MSTSSIFPVIQFRNPHNQSITDQPYTLITNLNSQPRMTL